MGPGDAGQPAIMVLVQPGQAAPWSAAAGWLPFKFFILIYDLFYCSI